MTDVETLKAEIKKLTMAATQAQMDLHDLSEELPLNWEKIPEQAQRTFEVHQKLAEKKAQLKALAPA